MKISRTRSLGPIVAAVVVFLSLTMAAGALVYSFGQQRNLDQALCQQTVDNRMGNRVTWNAARNLILRTSENPDGINEFFDAILETIPPLECVDNKPVEVA